MDFWLNFRLKVRDFIVKYKWIFIVGIVVIFIIGGISLSIRRGEVKIKPGAGENDSSGQTEPIVNPENKASESDKDKIEKVIADYFDYCNNKEYEKAYILLNDDFKNLYFKNINRFKTYIDKIFTTKKMYKIDNYSNFDNLYVYKINILNDLLASGGTDDDSETLSDKFVFKKENGEFKISLNGYCGQEDLNIISEDDYMEVNILNRRIYYDRETYVVQYKNKTNNYIVLANGQENEEIGINIQGRLKFADTLESNMVILPNEITTKTINIEKYADNGKQTTQYILNAIRVLPKYSGNPDNLETEMNNAVKKYSMTINLVENE